MDLREALYAASEPRETKVDVIDYFKERYPGVRYDKRGRATEEWRSKLADALAPIATNKEGQPISRATILRRLQGTRGGGEKVTPKVAEEYSQLGQLLPPRPPENGFRIFGTIYLAYSEICEPRDIDITVTGDDAQELIRNPDIQSIINRYNQQEMDTEEPIAISCGDDELEIEPL